MNIIEISHATKDYGLGRGVFDISFHVKKGEILGFLGPNGAGKTTTIRQLMGFIKPDSGSLSILGMHCFKQAHIIGKSLGYLPGEIALIDSMRGNEFIQFIAQVKGMKDQGRIPELLDMFELNPGGHLKKMSKGMKQKIAIVCAFMQDPDILILDEPTSGLDPLMQNKFIDLLIAERARGKTILMSSHIFEEVERTCDRAAIIRNGKLVAVEDMNKLRTNKQKIIELRFDCAASANSFAQSMSGALVKDVSVTVTVTGQLDQFIKAAGQYTVTDINIHTQTLEDFFMHFYGGDDR